jgi:Arc/MetJ family transcription regulator
VWSAAWAADPEREAQRLATAYERAVADADAYDWAVAAVEADVVAGMPEDTSTSDAGGGKPGGKKGKRGGKARRKSRDRRPRPRVPANRAISSYTPRELAAVARWVETDGRTRSEDDLMAEVAAELSVPTDGAYTDDVLRHAVRLARGHRRQGPGTRRRTPGEGQR